MPCENPECQSGKPVFARGLCQGCYYRVRRRGVLGRKYHTGGSSGQCRIDECVRNAHATGLCAKHYQQTINPMRNVWKVARSRAQGAWPAKWDDFDAFIADVGEKPGEKYQLRRIRSAEPWGIGNFEWRSPVKIDGATTGLTADMAMYQWAWSLKTKYGLTPETAQKIIDAQNGLCPACQKPLGYFGPTSRQEATTIVDHDHVHDGRPRVYAVRGIMHRTCNSGMGQLGECATTLRRAADHIDAHDRRKALGISILDEIRNGEN